MPSKLSSRLAAAVQWGVLIALSAGIAAFLLWIHAPAALMLGPLIAGIVVAASGGKVAFPLPPFVLAQGVVGCLIASMVPLSIVDDVLRHWVLFGAGVVLVVVVSSLLGWLMTRWQMMPGTTALWGTSAGAASVMTIMAEHYGADPRLVAFMQYLRVVLVAVIAADRGPAVRRDARHTCRTTSSGSPPSPGCRLPRRWRSPSSGRSSPAGCAFPAGAFLVPLVLGIVLTHFGLIRIELPTWLLAASYAFVGWNVGLRFTRPLLIHALKALPVIFGATLTLIALCGAIAAAMVWLAGVDPLTAYLATSPGGSDSIAIIAASTNVDVSFVMAMQTVRMIAVLFLAPVLTKFIAERLRYPNDRPP